MQLASKHKKPHAVKAYSASIFKIRLEILESHVRTFSIQNFLISIQIPQTAGVKEKQVLRDALGNIFSNSLKKSFLHD